MKRPQSLQAVLAGLPLKGVLAWLVVIAVVWWGPSVPLPFQLQEVVLPWFNLLLLIVVFGGAAAIPIFMAVEAGKGFCERCEQKLGRVYDQRRDGRWIAVFFSYLFELFVIGAALYRDNLFHTVCPWAAIVSRWSVCGY
jgi:hypothetical protein